MHLCVDMQRLFGPGSPWAAPWIERILPTVLRLVNHSASRTVFTRFIPARSAEEARGRWTRFYRKWESVTLDRLNPELLDLLPSLDRFSPPAEKFDRTTYSAFADGRLHKWLRERDVTTLIVSGAETDVCVLATVLAGVDLGYRTIIVRNALASSADETHDALLALYSRRYDIQIELADVDEMIAAWHPEK
ncbi:MAG: cysteine hydrolase [bacterium]|nr:cysteine hydrolase [bacterium]